MKLSPNVERDREDDVSLSSQRSEKKSLHRATRSNTPSSSTSKSSQDEAFLSVRHSPIGPISLLKDIVSSVEHENLRGTPLVFLGAEKFTRIRFDWHKIRYPLTPSQIEPIVDLISHRPSFVRQIAPTCQLNLYRRLTETIRGHCFFDGENHRAAEHQCHRKDLPRKFTLDDLRAMHRREFHLIQFNASRDQRVQNLVESLFPVYEISVDQG